jgi:hypothetical protein
MGLENRSGHSYYYRKERAGDTVRSVYVGSGLSAQIAMRLDEIERIEQREKVEAARLEREANLKQDAEIDALGLLVNEVVKAALIAQGFHQHKRQWRRRKG